MTTINVLMSTLIMTSLLSEYDDYNVMVSTIIMTSLLSEYDDYKRYEEYPYYDEPTV